MKLTSMQKMFVAIGLVVVAILVVVVVVILPKLGQLSQLDADLAAAQAEVQQTQTLLAQLQQAKFGAALTQAELLRLANEFPENPDLPSLIIELQDVSNDSGVRFNSVRPGDPVMGPGDTYQEVPIAVKVVGRWEDVLDYLRRINSMTRAVRVTDVALAPSAAALSSAATSTLAAELAADLSMKAYVMSPVAAGAVPGAPSTGTTTPAQTQ